MTSQLSHTPPCAYHKLLLLLHISVQVALVSVYLVNNYPTYRISSNRSPRPLLAQLCQTPGLYSRPGLYLRPGFYSRKYGSSQNYQFRQYFASVYRYSTNRTSTMNCTVHHEVQYCNLDHFMTKHHFGHSIIIKVIRRKLFTNEVAGLYQYLTNIKQYL